MSQYDFGDLSSPLSGTTLINTHLEPWRNALHSMHKGNSRPSYAAAGMIWINGTTNPWVVNAFDGADDIAIGTIDTSTNQFTPSNVTPASGSITNTMLATMAANTVKANNTGSTASPSDVALSASTILARLAAGNIVAATTAQIKTLLAIAFTDITGTLAATAGGTGQSAFTAGDLIYCSATNVLSKLGIGTTGQRLGIASGVPAWENDYIPQNSKSAAYTTVLADAGKHILHPTADNNARTFTIDSNANVAYPVGTAITFVNQINTVTIAITSDTMKLAGAGTTGNRTLAANGIATALKIDSTNWIISGSGLT